MSRGRRSRDRGYISGNRVTSAPTYDEVIVNYLVVAGGGGGGDGVNSSWGAGGGGAGGLRSTVTATGGGGALETAIQVTTLNSYTVTVGAGGTSNTSGSNSVFSSITSTGGGRGGGTNAAANGGSGGGAKATPIANTVGTGTSGQGFAGGSNTTASPYRTGGGGGAGSVGTDGASQATSGNGGAGVASSITGSSITYAGGGGGGASNSASAGTGGSGGGGNGGSTAGTANTGGGGGGGNEATSAAGGAGGSGVVILRYSNLYTLNIGAGLSYSTQTVNDDKVTTFTSGSGSISLSPAPVTTGDYESIATVLVGSAGASSITFSNIPQTYKHLQIRFNYSANTTNDNIHLRFNNDTSANYSWHEMYSSSTESPGNVQSFNYGGTLVTTAKFGYVGTTSAGFTGVGTSDILDYTNTNKIKVARHLVGTTTNGSGSYLIQRSVAWHNTGAINSITIYSPPGLITQHSHFALYGIRG